MPPSARRASGGPPVNAETILETAAKMVDVDGVKALTMRNLADQLDVAVTSIYWHIGGRDQVLDSLVERLLGELANLPLVGATPVERIRSLARSLRVVLIERQHLLGIAHERDRTAHLFLPIEQALAEQLAELGVTGHDAALILRTVQMHVISSALLRFSALRGASYYGDRSPWVDAWPDRTLATALQAPTDYDAVFEYGLDALLKPLLTAVRSPEH